MAQGTFQFQVPGLKLKAEVQILHLVNGSKLVSRALILSPALNTAFPFLFAYSSQISESLSFFLITFTFVFIVGDTLLSYEPRSSLKVPKRKAEPLMHFLNNFLSSVMSLAFPFFISQLNLFIYQKSHSLQFSPYAIALQIKRKVKILNMFTRFSVIGSQEYFQPHVLLLHLSLYSNIHRFLQVFKCVMLIPTCRHILFFLLLVCNALGNFLMQAG